MAREKQYVFSARTTEEGLRRLNGIREEKKIGWDELVLDAVCDRYGLDRAVMALPKKEKPTEETKGTEEQQERTIGVGMVQEEPAGETPAKKRGKGKGKK